MTSAAPASNNPDSAEHEQFRLRRIQTYNWGTFSGLSDFPIPRDGYLFVGPSGSGKSTILDAHAALLTPPKWLDFNVAARENDRKGHDRNAVTYVRGAWAEQTGETGEYVKQYLRADTTWSAIASTYENGRGQTVVLCQLLWIRGKSTANSDVRKLHIIFERSFELREFEFFPSIDFDVRQFKLRFPGEFIKEEFSPYQERFRRWLGIDNERALRLLHKTQSAKNLGDLNVFLRDFMLDAPQTFEVADQLVAEFGELSAAHQAVVAAKTQIETLAPARESYRVRETDTQAKTDLDHLVKSLDPYRKQLRKRLLDELVTRLGLEAASARSALAALEAVAQREENTLHDMEERRREQGGRLIEQLEQQRVDAERQRAAVAERKTRADAACLVLGWRIADGAEKHIQMASDARLRVENSAAEREQRDRITDELKDRARVLADKLKTARVEIASMEGQKSNIGSRLLNVRRLLAAALDVPENRLPFVGELVEVKEEEARWQGAIERVLHSFAISLLVEDRLYAGVLGYLNREHIGERLLYNRVLNDSSAPRTVRTSSLARKLKVAPGTFLNWVDCELRAKFDYQCVESDQELMAAVERTVSLQGQVKHNSVRHEKNDKFRIDDRRYWVLGANNHEKLELYKEEVFEAAQDLEAVTKKIGVAREIEAQSFKELMGCQLLMNTTWADIDVASAIAQIDGLAARIDAEKAARPNLAELDRLIEGQASVHKAAERRRRDADAELADKERQLKRRSSEADGLAVELRTLELSATTTSALNDRFGKLSFTIDLDTLADAGSRVQRSLHEEKELVATRLVQLENAIRDRFKEFNRQWPAESDGLDPEVASAADYFIKLERLEKDALPKYEERFRTLLREQSDQNLMLLSTHLEQERKAIRDRMSLVNESLEGAAFNQGSHLVIETHDKMLDDVRGFKQSLKDALSHSLSGEFAAAEQRFAALQALVKRLASQDTTDQRWRAVVLDVRQHVEFIAKEVDVDGVELEVYRSGAGKSGGQRQKLAATCLAAALRYQLGGRDRGLPMFSTIAIDEAFDKADPEFTALAMNIFKTFGFQMLVATPLKSVMALEPFIGGACFVYIRDRKTSAVIPIEYNADLQRLNLTSATHHANETPIS